MGWVMLVVRLDVFADTPTQEQRDPPSTSFGLGALRAPPGSAARRLATLATAPPPPEGHGADRRTHIYRNNFTPAGNVHSNCPLGCIFSATDTNMNLNHCKKTRAIIVCLAVAVLGVAGGNWLYPTLTTMIRSWHTSAEIRSAMISINGTNEAQRLAAISTLGWLGKPAKEAIPM